MARKSKCFKSYFLSLPEPERSALAKDAGTTVGYIKTHLIGPPYRRRIPRQPLMTGLAAALEKRNAGISARDLAAYFYDIAA